MAHFINCISCGKQYNKDVFDKCPFCGSLQIIPQKTAEEIINEHKHKEELVKEQNEEILKDAVRKRYNVAGDISEEQYGQLKEIYMKEYGNKDDTHEHEHSSGQRNGYVGWIIGIVAALIIFLIIFFASGGGHSNTYNEYMSRIKAREAAINKATSLFDLPEYDWNMWYIGTSMYLEGDEKRDIDNAISSLSDSYINKVRQLAVGRYRIVSKSRHTYLLDLTNETKEVLVDGLIVHYIARIYRDNILLGTGVWSAGASSFDIEFKQDPNNCYDDIKIDIYPKKETQTFEWMGKLEMGEYGFMRGDEGTAEKIK